MTPTPRGDLAAVTSAPGIAARLDAAYADLSPQERRAADFMRGHIGDLAVYNATEVAGLSGVSKATVSRLYRRLGFRGADDLRASVRSERSTGVPQVGAAPANFATHLEREIANLRAALTGLDLAAPAAAIATAERVLVIGYRNSYPVALHLRQQLAQARAGVVLAPAPGQSIGEEIAGLTATDTVVIVGFRRRPASFARVIAALAASPAHVVLLTDDSGRRYARDVDEAIVCPIDTVASFDSYAAVSSVVSLLAAAVLGERPQQGRKRIASIGAAYDDLGELE